MQEPTKESLATKSALCYGIAASMITAILGLAAGIAMYNAYSEVNDTAGLGLPQMGMTAVPVAGGIVGGIRYLWLMRE